MSENVQKYENWRAITESDYVTMFIKTWFAFVATLRELYPKETLEEVIGKGDKVYLNPYLDDFQNKFYHYNKMDVVKDNILKVYKLGRCFTLENHKYNRFFSEDFYAVNKAYAWKQDTDDYELSIKYSRDTEICIHAKYLDKDFYIDGAPLIISVKIDISDLISSENLSEAQTTKFIDDESAFIESATKAIIDRASLSFIGQITNGDFNSKFDSKVLARLNSVTLAINATLVQELALMKEPNIIKEDVLFSQLPCVHFIYKVEDGQTVPEIDTYKWFLNFVYFMRNALFHEIIDPLDSFWQDLFKHSYLALKEILDGNINYFVEKDKITGLLYYRIWDELREKDEVYLPNFDDGLNNGDVEITLTDYEVNDTSISIKAIANLDYWYDAYSLKRMHAKCKATFTKNTDEITNFKMVFEKLTDVPKGD